jgi:Fungal protein kinase
MFLRLVKERKVWGVIKLLGQQDIESIANLHQGLELGASRRLLPVTGKQSQMEQLSAKSFGGDPPISKNRDVGAITSSDIGGQGVSEYSVNATATRQMGAGSAKAEPLEDNIFSCVVTYPYGRRLEDFESIVEFLETLRDAITGLFTKSGRYSTKIFP